MASRLPLLFSCALFAAAPFSAQAAELGEPRVSSFIGQPLVADIELTMLEDAGAPVQVRLASANVYRGANIGMPAVLSTLRLSVMRRDGRQYLHVTSLKPVEAAHLHLYLELADGSQQNVRLATLWLSPDPNPAPPVPAPALPVVAPVVAKVAAAEPPKPVATPPAPAPVAAPSTPKPPVLAAPRKAVKPAPRKPEPVAAPIPAPIGASCVPQVEEQANACVALRAKNALLREQLGQLEDKVKVLQAEMGAPTAAVVQPVKPFKPKKKKKPEPAPEAGTPWLLVGGGIAAVLAVAAAVLVALRRRKAPKRLVEPKVSLGTRLKARLGRKPAAAKAVEPTMEERAHDSSTQV